MTPNRRVTWQATSNDENFLATLGGAAAAWPVAARAQQAEQMGCIGVLIAPAESDPEGQLRIAAFRQGL